MNRKLNSLKKKNSEMKRRGNEIFKSNDDSNKKSSNSKIALKDYFSRFENLKSGMDPKDETSFNCKTTASPNKKSTNTRSNLKKQINTTSDSLLEPATSLFNYDANANKENIINDIYHPNFIYKTKKNEIFKLKEKQEGPFNNDKSKNNPIHSIKNNRLRFLNEFMVSENAVSNNKYISAEKINDNNDKEKDNNESDDQGPISLIFKRKNILFPEEINSDREINKNNLRNNSDCTYNNYCGSVRNNENPYEKNFYYNDNKLANINQTIKNENIITLKTAQIDNNPNNYNFKKTNSLKDALDENQVDDLKNLTFRTNNNNNNKNNKEISAELIIDQHIENFDYSNKSKNFFIENAKYIIDQNTNNINTKLQSVINNNNKNIKNMNCNLNLAKRSASIDIEVKKMATYKNFSNVKINSHIFYNSDSFDKQTFSNNSKLLKNENNKIDKNFDTILNVGSIKQKTENFSDKLFIKNDNQKPNKISMNDHNLSDRNEKNNQALDNLTIHETEFNSEKSNYHKSLKLNSYNEGEMKFLDTENPLKNNIKSNKTNISDKTKQKIACNSVKNNKSFPDLNSLNQNIIGLLKDQFHSNNGYDCQKNLYSSYELYRENIFYDIDLNSSSCLNINADKNKNNCKDNKNISIKNVIKNPIINQSQEDDLKNKSNIINGTTTLGGDDIIIQNDNNSNNDKDKEKEEKLTCKICLEINSKYTEVEEEKFISPCLCQGTMKWVHESCLKKWIPTQVRKTGKAECEICKCKYKIKFTIREVYSSEKMCSFLERFFTFLGIICLMLFIIDFVIYSIVVNIVKFSEEEKQKFTLILSLTGVGIVLLVIGFILKNYRDHVYEQIPTGWSVLNYDSDIPGDKNITYEIFKKLNIELENSQDQSNRREPNYAMDNNNLNANLNNNNHNNYADNNINAQNPISDPCSNPNENNNINNNFIYQARENYNNITNFASDNNLQQFINDIEQNNHSTQNNVAGHHHKQYKNNFYYSYNNHNQNNLAFDNKNIAYSDTQNNYNDVIINEADNTKDIGHYNDKKLEVINDANMTFVQDKSLFK